MTNKPSEPQGQSQVSEILQAWKTIGDELFINGETIIVPKIALVRATAELFAIEVALTKHNGNITHAGRDLDASRRTIRDKLKKAGRYPWRLLWSPKRSVT